MSTISATVARRKKWSCATSSTRPMRPTSLSRRRTSASRNASSVGDVAHARRTKPLRAAEQRRDPAPRASHRHRRQAHLVAGEPHPRAVERDVLGCEPARAAARQQAGAGRRGSSCSRSRSRPMPGRSGLSAWNACSFASSVRLSSSHTGADIANMPSARLRARRWTARSIMSCICARRTARGRARMPRARQTAARSQAARPAPLRVADRVGLQVGRAAPACGACAPARADRGTCRRRWCAAPVVSRRTKRSPAAAAIGWSSTSCTQASLAGRNRRRLRAARCARRPRRRHDAAAPASIA